MILLLRIFLVGLVIYLLTRSFALYFQGEEEQKEDRRDKKEPDIRKISKEIGEYVDYEEIDKK